jgi:hypothetical protein
MPTPCKSIIADAGLNSCGRSEHLRWVPAARTTKTPHEQESLQRTIAATDKQIDLLVYELYGLTEEEIRIVEEGSR